MPPKTFRRLKILTWHVHSSYLYYLSHVPHDFHIVTRPGNPPGYAGRVGDLPWPSNLRAVPEAMLREHEFDCVLYQSSQHYRARRESLSPAQLALPALYVEHDPPQESPVDAPHFAAQDPNTLIVHVTPFNALMWNNGSAPWRIVEHGVAVPPGVGYTGEKARGVAVVNHMRARGRRVGIDVFGTLRERLPLDLAGMDAESLGGVGEIRPTQFAAFVADYRFFFSPARYTSPGLEVIEAMMIGMPIVGLATTEMSTVIKNGRNGFVDTRLPAIEDAMRRLLADPGLACEWGAQARRDALERFNIDRFVADWRSVFADVAN